MLGLKAARIHLVMAGFWLLMTIPTVIWLRNSILYVSFLSLYALIVGHLAAFEAARSTVGKATLDQVRAMTDALANFMESYYRERPDEDLDDSIEELRDSLDEEE